MLRSPGQILENKAQFRLVESGRSDNPVSPIATGNYDPARHFCLMSILASPPIAVIIYIGGYYQWSGSSLVFQAWPSTVPPWSNQGGIFWNIYEVVNLAAPIQHGQTQLNMISGSGYVNYDVPISVPDYLNTMLISTSMGSFSQSGGISYGHQKYLVSNSILRIRHYQSGGAMGLVPHTWVLIPLDS